MFCKNCGEPMNDNQAICLKCGVAKGKGEGFCPNCGAPISPLASVCVSCGVAVDQNANDGKVNPASVGVKKRSLVTAIILSIVTCGIYGIYWFVVLTDEMNKLTGKTGETSGGMAFLLSLVTCGIYSIYWAYKMGQKKDELEGTTGGSSAVLNLVLSIFGLGIVVYILTQSAINKAVDGYQ